jgi:hypothetical protein
MNIVTYNFDFIYSDYCNFVLIYGLKLVLEMSLSFTPELKDKYLDLLFIFLG